MGTTRIWISFKILFPVVITTLALFTLLSTPSPAQILAGTNDALASSSDSIVTDASLNLPNAPEAPNASTFDRSVHPVEGFGFNPSQSTPIKIKKYVEAGTFAPPLTAGDKVLLGLRSAVYPIPALGWVFSAGYSQVLNNRPNYGTDSKAFAQRLGAAAARNVSEGIVSDSIMASVLHEDPRYYELGVGHSFFKRITHAATHAVITRTDDGDATPNYALFTGNLVGAALTNTYYPQQNRGFGNTLKTFGGSMGGSAFGFVAAEFARDALRIVHLERFE